GFSRCRYSGAFPVFREEELVIGLSDDFLGSVPEDIVHRGAGIGVTALLVLLPDPLAGHVDDLAETGFAFPQRLLGGLAFSDVLDHVDGELQLSPESVSSGNNLADPYHRAVFSNEAFVQAVMPVFSFDQALEPLHADIEIVRVAHVENNPV